MATESEGEPEDIQLYLRASEKLYPALIHRIESCELFKPPLSYRGRVKSKDSVEEKIAERRGRGLTYGITDVTDLVGIRFITMLRMSVAEPTLGIPGVTARLLDLLARPGNGELGDFGSAALHELNVYLAYPPHDVSKEGDWLDPVYDKLEEMLEDAPAIPLDRPGKITKQQYSGVHLVVKFEVDIDGRRIVVPAEIQVRSVFEEAWGEIDHRLFYKSDQTSEGPRSTVTKDLGILKAVLDNAERLAESIAVKGTVLTKLANAVASNPEIRPNLDGDDYAKSIASTVTYKRDVIDEYLALVREKEEIDRTRYDRAESSKRKHLGLAARLRRLFDDGFGTIRIEDVPADQRERIQALAFLMLMDQAVCLFLDGMAEQVGEAIELYEDITSGEPFPGLEGHKHPTAWFRMGEAKNWMIENAGSEAERARLAAEAVEAFAKARETLTAVPESEHLIIAREQRAHLDQNIERLRGFALWRLSDMRRKGPDAQPQLIDLENVRRAWEIVEERTKALVPPFSKEGLFLFNTALYFAIDGVSLCEELGQKPTGFPSKASIKTMLDTLDEQMKQLGFKDEKFSHTRMDGALLLGDAERAARAAVQVMWAHVRADTSRFSPYQKDMHDRVAREAWDVMQAAKPPDES